MTEHDAYLALERLWWDGEQTCPRCGAVGAYYISPANGISRATRTGTQSQRRVWTCKTCDRQFSVLTGTPLEGTKVPIRTWLAYLAVTEPIGTRAMMRRFGVDGATARRMRARRAFITDSGSTGSGLVAKAPRLGRGDRAFESPLPDYVSTAS